MTPARRSLLLAVRRAADVLTDAGLPSTPWAACSDPVPRIFVERHDAACGYVAADPSGWRCDEVAAIARAEVYATLRAAGFPIAEP
jgi:hypothetical protein